jgi:23S rRNA (guanine745-N1)-methyltransferase
MLICPVCSEPLQFEERTAFCANGHRFDMAKEGYVNLLRGTKSGNLIGDDKTSARCRRDFLNKGYYSALKNAVCDIFHDREGSVLDICCGEGYYSAALAENPALKVFGFDISKEMVRLASKRGVGRYFVANLASIPIAEGSMDYAIHLFAPFQEAAFLRVLRPGGRLITVVPGSHHLFQLKQAIYETPYVNDEEIPQTTTLKFISTRKISDEILLSSQDDIQAVFRMTPYYFHTTAKDKEKLLPLTELQTTVEFVLAEFERPY